MIPKLTDFLALTHLKDRDDYEIAQLLRAILLIIFLPSLFMPPIYEVIDHLTGAASFGRAGRIGGSFIALSIMVLFVLLRQGRVRLVSFLLSLLVFLEITLEVYTHQGFFDDMLPAYALVIGMSGLLLGGFAAIAASAATTIALSLNYLLVTNGIIEMTPKPAANFGGLFMYSVIFVMLGFLLRSAINTITIRSDRFRHLSHELRLLNQNLEDQVAERTRALRLSLEVSHHVSNILNPQLLVAEVVDLIRQTFDYYHVHLYLLDEQAQSLVMAGGTGEAGQRMLAKGHRLTLQQGIVGQAARQMQPVLIPDVTQSENWLPNELLPHTVTEVAVPVVLGDQLLGVLDVQHHVQNGLTGQDVELLQTVANQLAVALRNARIMVTTQQDAEREAFLNQISRKVQQAPDMESVLRIAAQEIGETLGATGTTVRIGQFTS